MIFSSKNNVIHLTHQLDYGSMIDELKDILLGKGNQEMYFVQ